MGTRRPVADLGEPARHAGRDRADGSHVTPIHLSLGDTGTTFAVTPAYSPDGSQIVFALFQRSQADLYVANRDGSDAHAITDTPD